MTPYEQYLLNNFKPVTMYGENEYGAGSPLTKEQENYNTQNVVVNELANRPKYNSRGERYGNTLSDDMFDIKNGRVGNYTDDSKPLSRHQWVSDLTDYSERIPLPEMEQPRELSAVEQYLAAHPMLNGTSDFRDRAISRKKNIGEGPAKDLYADLDYGSANDVDFLQNPEFIDFLQKNRDYNALQSQINDLGTESLAEDMRSLKGGAEHSWGRMTPRFVNAEWEPTVETDVNYNRLSPETLRMLAQMGPRPDVMGYEPDTNEPVESGLNSLINLYRRNMGLR